MSGLVLVTLEQGMIFAMLAMGVYITYKILDFPDLSVEGSFPLGAFVFAKFSLLGWNPLLATMMGFLAGGLVGLFTYTLNIKFKIKPIIPQPNISLTTSYKSFFSSFFSSSKF